jgi:site-specific DNA-methyltransferase (adenine-specific)/modification methylase
LQRSISLLKDNGHFITFCRLENITDFINIYSCLGLKHHATIIWHKTNPAPRVRKTGFLFACEAILWAVKEPEGQKKKEYTFHFGKQNEMHNFIETPICMGKERTAHTTQKPLKLIDKLVTTFTNEGDLVLDPFAGSGTLGQSCSALNRRCILIERDTVSANIIRERLGLGVQPDGL